MTYSIKALRSDLGEVTDEEFNKLRNAISDATTSLLTTHPLIGLFLSNIKIVAVKLPVDYVAVAMTDGRKIIINPVTFLSLPPREQLFALIHEVMHIFLLHCIRATHLYKLLLLRGIKMKKEAFDRISNILCDVVADLYAARLVAEPNVDGELYRTYVKSLDAWFVRPTPAAIASRLGISVSALAKMSLEDLFFCFLNNLKKELEKLREQPGQQGSQQAQALGTTSQRGSDKDHGSGAPCSAAAQQAPYTSQLGGQQSGAAGTQSQQSQPGTSGEDDITWTKELVDELLSRLNMDPQKYFEDLIIGTSELDELIEKYGRTVRRGKEIPKDPKHAEEVVKDLIREAYVTAKSIGTVPGFLEEVVQALLKYEVPWRRLLRSAINRAIGDDVTRTWMKPSKKVPELPGKRSLGMGTVWVMIDVSGSISALELQKFLGEVYGIFRECSPEKVVVVEWDAALQKIYEMRSPDDAKKVHVTGRGGTMIKPALSYVYERVKPGEPVVILSDWFIGDIDDEEVQNMLRDLSRKARCIAVTTSEQPKVPKQWITTRIKINVE